VRRAISGDASLRMVGTIAPVVDPGAKGDKLLRYPTMQGADGLFLVKSVGDARLVCDHERIIAGVVHKLNRLFRAAHPLDPMRRVDIAVVDVEDAVTVKEDGRPATLARHALSRD
jgi:hypothetical protein